MTVKLVLHNSHKVNVLNLVSYHLMEHCPEKWYGACRGKINQIYPWLSSTPGELELETIKRFSLGLRYVDWSKKQEFLTECVSLAEQNNQDLFFGSHSIDQLEFLKNFFGDRSFIIGLTYDKADYDYILDDLARTHVHLITTGEITANDHDIECMTNNSTNKMIEHYKTVFDSSRYIPEYVNFLGDYEIPFRDYFNVSLMEKHFSNIGFPINNESKSLYHKWVSAV